MSKFSLDLGVDHQLTEQVADLNQPTSSFTSLSLIPLSSALCKAALGLESYSSLVLPKTKIASTITTTRGKNIHTTDQTKREPQIPVLSKTGVEFSPIRTLIRQLA